MMQKFWTRAGDASEERREGSLPLPSAAHKGEEPAIVRAASKMALPGDMLRGCWCCPRHEPSALSSTLPSEQLCQFHTLTYDIFSFSNSLPTTAVAHAFVASNSSFKTGSVLRPSPVLPGMILSFTGNTVRYV